MPALPQPRREVVGGPRFRTTAYRGATSCCGVTDGGGETWRGRSTARSCERPPRLCGPPRASGRRSRTGRRRFASATTGPGRPRTPVATAARRRESAEGLLARAGNPDSRAPSGRSQNTPGRRTSCGRRQATHAADRRLGRSKESRFHGRGGPGLDPRAGSEPPRGPGRRGAGDGARGPCTPCRPAPAPSSRHAGPAARPPRCLPTATVPIRAATRGVQPRARRPRGRDPSRRASP